MRRAPAAKINIVVNDIALPLAQAMQEQYNIPYVYFNRFAAPEKILQAYQHLFAYLALPLPADEPLTVDEAAPAATGNDDERRSE